MHKNRDLFFRTNRYLLLNCGDLTGNIQRYNLAQAANEQAPSVLLDYRTRLAARRKR